MVVSEQSSEMNTLLTQVRHLRAVAQEQSNQITSIWQAQAPQSNTAQYAFPVAHGQSNLKAVVNPSQPIQSKCGAVREPNPDTQIDETRDLERAIRVLPANELSEFQDVLGPEPNDLLTTVESYSGSGDPDSSSMDGSGLMNPISDDKLSNFQFGLVSDWNDLTSVESIIAGRCSRSEGPDSKSLDGSGSMNPMPGDELIDLLPGNELSEFQNHFASNPNDLTSVEPFMITIT